MIATPACVLYDGGIQGDRYLFPVVSETHGTEGFIGGKLGEMPDIAFKQPLVPGSHTSWRMTSEWVIRWHDQLAVRRWADTTEFPIQPGTAPYDIKGTGGDVFFRVGSFVGAGVMTWSESKGARDLIRYPNAPERGAANFGTDGVDMVWTYGEGLPSRSSQWLVTRSIMTAPYSTDADTVAKTARRLRSDQHLPAMMDGFAVGCGYAARNFYQPLGDSSHANTLLIVRLSDGVSWSVTMPSTKSGAQLTHALGVTCEEVFSKAQFPDESSAIVRIRLDSLGPGMPPD